MYFITFHRCVRCWLRRACMLQTRWWHLIPGEGVPVSESTSSIESTVVISASCSEVCVWVWGSWVCVSVGRGSVGLLPRPDTAADAGGFTLLSNPLLWCSREWLPGRELTLSPLPRRGSRFWGRAEGRISPFWETSRPFWVSTDSSKPPASALELLPLGLFSFVLSGVNTGDWVEGAAVGASLSERSGKQNKSLKMSREHNSGWFCHCPAGLIWCGVI